MPKNNTAEVKAKSCSLGFLKKIKIWSQNSDINNKLGQIPYFKNFLVDFHFTSFPKSFVLHFRLFILSEGFLPKNQDQHGHLVLTEK